MKRRICIWIVLLAALAWAAGPVPNPTVIGPIPATVPPGDPSHSYPFFSTTVDLARYGYIEEEFLLEGTANRYNTPPLATGSVIDGGHRYRTRMIVRRPAMPQKFDGTVLMEWQNVSANMDIDAGWAAPIAHNHVIRSGYAWVGVSAQRAGIDSPVTGLKAWSPARYGTLDVTDGGTILNDAVCYDIFSQAAQAVRKPIGIDPMGGLSVKRVIATGVSQGALRLAPYHNSIRPLAGVFDGILLAVSARQLRTDLDIKVFKLLTETEILRQPPNVRQPDSDRVRSWEVTGAAHYPFESAQAIWAIMARDGVFSPGGICELPPLSRIPLSVVANSAVDHLVRWVRDNVSPPTAALIEVASLGPPVIIARDSFGNALGGIRLSQHAVPTATNTGYNSGLGFCYTFGSFQPFDAATLDTLYPNHGMYVSQVTQSAHENLKDGYVVLEDAIATVQEAAQSGIGK